MNIIVIGVAPKSTNCWDALFETLDNGVAEGVVTYKTIDYFEAVEDEILQYDGAIYLDNAPITEEIPFMALDGCEFDEAVFFEFIDVVEEYLASKQNDAPQETKTEEKAEVVVHPKDEKTIKLSDISYEITEDEVSKLVFKAVTTVINGKEVKLNGRDFIALGKMCKIMDRFGYKVKNVVV